MTEQQSFPIQLRSTIEQRSAEFAAMLDPLEISSERFVRVALLAVTKNKKLWECSPESVLLAIMESARAGLMIDNKEAALIPYGGYAEFMPMVKGIINLMLRSPGVLKIESRVVREGDEFEFEYGLRPNLVHWPESLDGPVTHAYAIIERQGTTPTFEVMGREQLDLVRGQSRAPDSPAYKIWPDEMDRKIVTKRLSKYVDLSPEATRAIEIDHAVTGGSWGVDYVDGPSDEYLNQLVKARTKTSLAKLSEKISDETEIVAEPPDEEVQKEDPIQEELAEMPGAPTVEELVLWINQRVNVNKGIRTNDSLVQNVAWMLGECFAGRENPDDERHRFMLVVFGKASTNDLTGSEVKSVLDFLEATIGKDEKYHPNAIRAKQARQIADSLKETENG